jgi:hypothetical protein
MHPIEPEDIPVHTDHRPYSSTGDIITAHDHARWAARLWQLLFRCCEAPAPVSQPGRVVVCFNCGAWH